MPKIPHLWMLCLAAALAPCSSSGATIYDKNFPPPVRLPDGGLPMPPVGPDGKPLIPPPIPLGAKFIQGGSSGSGGSSESQEQATNIANTGTQTYYAGVIQIAAGVSQVSRAAQNRSSNGSTEQNRQELVTGLTNLSAGSESVYKAREMVAHANSILATQERLKSAGQNGPASAFNLSFDRSKAGELGNHVLNEMESVADVPAETLISHVNDDENIYDLAANAKGLTITSDELATAAETALAKAGKNPNPEIANGAKLNDLMKDLDMFMAKKGDAPVVAPEATVSRAVASAQPQIESPQVYPSSQDSAPAQANADNPYLDKLVQAASNELAADASIFQMVSRQYRKRDLGLNVRSAK